MAVGVVLGLARFIWLARQAIAGLLIRYRTRDVQVRLFVSSTAFPPSATAPFAESPPPAEWPGTATPSRRPPRNAVNRAAVLPRSPIPTYSPAWAGAGTCGQPFGLPAQNAPGPTTLCGQSKRKARRQLAARTGSKTRTRRCSGSLNQILPNSSTAMPPTLIP